MTFRETPWAKKVGLDFGGVPDPRIFSVYLVFPVVAWITRWRHSAVLSSALQLACCLPTLDRYGWPWWRFALTECLLAWYFKDPQQIKRCWQFVTLWWWKKRFASRQIRSTRAKFWAVNLNGIWCVGVVLFFALPFIGTICVGFSLAVLERWKQRITLADHSRNSSET